MLTVLGTTTVDIFIRGVDAMPEQGDGEFSNRSLVWLDRPVLSTLGGNGANAAYAAASLGVDVRLWSCIGADPFGDMVLGWLKSRSVDAADLYVSSTAGTATTVVVTDTVLRRNSFHYPGPVSEFEPGGRTFAGREGDWLLVTGYPLLQGWRGDANSRPAWQRAQQWRTHSPRYRADDRRASYRRGAKAAADCGGRAVLQ